MLTNSKTQDSVLDDARLILETIPRSMRHVRTHVREAAGVDFTTPQYRVLSKIARESSTVSELAEWMGVRPPTMSRMVDALVSKKLVARGSREETGDRRQIRLRATARGAKQVAAIRASTQRELAKRMAQLTDAQRRSLRAGLAVLKELFG